MKFENLLLVAPFSGKRVRPFEGQIPYLSTGSIQDNALVFESVTYVTKPSRADIVVKPGDILFARMKNTNKVLFVTDDLEDIIVSTGFSVHRPIEKVLSGKFLIHYLKNRLFQRQKDKYCTGAIQPAITNEGLENIKIPLPVFDDQIRIANVLTRAEKLIAKRKESIKALDEFLKSTFLEMFGPSSSNFDKWPIVEIKDLAADHKSSIRTGPFGSNLLHGEFTETGDVAVLGIDNAVQNKFAWNQRRYITIDKYNELSSYRIFPGDVIITIMGTIGRSAVIPDDIPLAINTKHLAAITLNKQKANPHFISFSMHSSPYIIKQLVSKNHGAIMNGLNLGLIKEIKLRKPPVELQNKFADIVEKVEAMKVKYNNSLVEMEKLYGCLSQRAFKGDFDLSRVPIEKIEHEVELKNEIKISSSVTTEMSPLKYYSEPELINILYSLADVPFSFNTLMIRIEQFSFADTPEYETVKEQIFRMLDGQNPLLSQTFGEVTNKDGRIEKKILLSVNK